MARQAWRARTRSASRRSLVPRSEWTGTPQVESSSALVPFAAGRAAAPAKSLADVDAVARSAPAHVDVHSALPVGARASGASLRSVNAPDFPADVHCVAHPQILRSLASVTTSGSVADHDRSLDHEASLAALNASYNSVEDNPEDS